MSDLASVVALARTGDASAFETLVRRFQDMAVGYGYSLLGDIQLAEDAAQEAFFEAFRTLDQLREPAAFPGWFRRIVFKQCDRLTRGRRVVSIPIQESDVLDNRPDQLQMLEQRESRDRIWRAVESLPEQQREALALFYISGYSNNEIAGFLNVPVSTVKKRLHSARNRLRDILFEEVEDRLRERRPSRTDQFASQIIEMINAARAGDAIRVRELFDRDPRLLAARDPLGNTALVVAVNSGHEALAAMLIEAGVRPDLHEAAAIGRTDLVAGFLSDDPDRLDVFSAEGFTPLALAAHFGQNQTVRFLIERGADVNLVSRHPIGVTPLHAALFGGRTEAALLLLEAGADPNARRGGRGWPRAGWTALHYAAGYGFVELIEPMIERGGDVNLRDEDGKTPLIVAEQTGQAEAEATLRRWESED